jgi:hypothetical protein
VKPIFLEGSFQRLLCVNESSYVVIIAGKCKVSNTDCMHYSSEDCNCLKEEIVTYHVAKLLEGIVGVE